MPSNTLHDAYRKADEYLTNLSIGAGYGIRNQLEGMRQMVAHPVDTANALWSMVSHPKDAMYAVGNSLADSYRMARSGPLGLGQVAGEFAPIGVPSGPRKLDAIYPDALSDAQKANFHNWFGRSAVTDASGAPAVVYHGSQRPDRIGDTFKRSRATSGPMSFFTDSPELASSYAAGKMDTSLEVNDYADWFRVKPPGARNTQPFTSAWWHMSPDERRAATEALYKIGKDEETSAIRVDPESNLVPRDHIDWTLKQNHGNALAAAKDIWLDSGSLFNEEDKFLGVLSHMGVKGVEPDFPHVAKPGVIPSYLAIQNPLDTSIFSQNSPDAQRIIAELEAAGKRKKAKYQNGFGADPWDKNNKSGQQWLESLRNDVATGSTHAWTSIPDWVTQTLQRLGYDGIKDVSGKNGGAVHTVWIPFNESQVKSALTNSGKFDPTKKAFTK